MGLTYTFFNVNDWEAALRYVLLAKENYDMSKK